MFRDPRQDTEAVREWKAETLPELKKEAKREGRTLFYADESSFLLNPKALRTYWLKNEDLEIDSWDKQFQTYGVCGAISTEGHFVHIHQQESFKGKHMVAFLKLLLDEISGKVTLVWDGASIHGCRPVRKFLESLPEGRLKLVRQPTYSPELNASEQVWNYLKNVLLRNRVFKNIDALAKAVAKALQTMELKTNVIKKFFHHPEVAFY